jgi:hypothetical protein
VQRFQQPRHGFCIADPSQCFHCRLAHAIPYLPTTQHLQQSRYQHHSYHLRIPTLNRQLSRQQQVAVQILFLRRASTHDPGQQVSGVGFVEQPCQQRERFAPFSQMQPQVQEAPGAACVLLPGVVQAGSDQVFAQGQVTEDEEVAVAVHLAQPR